MRCTEGIPLRIFIYCLSPRFKSFNCNLIRYHFRLGEIVDHLLAQPAFGAATEAFG